MDSRHFDFENNSWEVTDELLGELDGDLQLVIDCAMESDATVRIESDLRIEVETPIEVFASIRIVGKRNNSSIPTLTCAGNRILRVR